MTLYATVLAVLDGALPVCDSCTHRQVLVHTQGTRCFRPRPVPAPLQQFQAMRQITAIEVCRICR